MSRHIPFLLFVLLALGLSNVSVATAASHTFDLEVRNGTLADTTGPLRVKQGDEVTLRWRSDTPVSLHLHGYDLELDVRPDTPGEWRLTAYAAGRFPITMHGGEAHEAVLVYLEVLP